MDEDIGLQPSENPSIQNIVFRKEWLVPKVRLHHIKASDLEMAVETFSQLTGAGGSVKSKMTADENTPNQTSKEHEDSRDSTCHACTLRVLLFLSQERLATGNETGGAWIGMLGFRLLGLTIPSHTILGK